MENEKMVEGEMKPKLELVEPEKAEFDPTKVKVAMADLKPMLELKAKMDGVLSQRMQNDREIVRLLVHMDSMQDELEKMMKVAVDSEAAVMDLQKEWKGESKLLLRMYGIPEDHVVSLQDGSVFKP